MPETSPDLIRIEVFYKIPDPRGEALCRKFRSLGFTADNVIITDIIHP